MKILLVTEDVPSPNLGGAGRHAITLGNALIEAGHEVSLLGRIASSEVVDKNGFLGDLYSRIGFGGTGWQEHRFGAFLPYRRHHIARRIWSEILALDPSTFDVIHYHGHVVELGVFVPEHINYVHTLHDQGSECIKLTRFVNGQTCLLTNSKDCAKCARSTPNVIQEYLSATAVEVHRSAAVEAFTRHKAIFVSEFLARNFISNLNLEVPLRYKVIHNFISPEILAHSDSSKTINKSGLPKILLAGRVDIYKGFTEFFDLAPDELLEKYEFRLAGDGPDMARLLARHGRRRITKLGFLNAKDVYQETVESVAAVVPSVWDEPCATTILEALAYGKRVWALRRGGTPELSKYEAYPRQLNLVETMTELVESLNAAVLGGDTSEINDMSVVTRRLDEIVTFYKEPKT